VELRVVQLGDRRRHHQGAESAGELKVRKTLIIIVFTCGALLGQSADSADPITDKLRVEIARMQRDLLLADAKMKDAIERYNAAKTEAEGLQKSLAEKIADASKACGDKKTFDTGKLACVEKGSQGK
jgi:signal transduction histidine kinase